jgi:acyl-CoA synthetase (NDP forming)
VLVIEGVRDRVAFERVIRRYAEAGKHLLVAKLGTSGAGARGALAHTSHLVGASDEYDELFARSGIVSVTDMEELIDVLQALTKAPQLRGPRVGIMTTSGGSGVWLADACSAAGFVVPELSDQVQDALKAHMPAYGSPVNPVDLTAQFLAGGSFVPPMRTLIESGEIDLLILTTSLSAQGRLSEDRAALAALIAESPVPIAIYSYTKPAPSSADILNELGLPWYTSSRRAARGLAALIPGSRP